MMQWSLILLTVFSSSAGDILCARGMSQGGELSDLARRGWCGRSGTSSRGGW